MVWHLYRFNPGERSAVFRLCKDFQHFKTLLWEVTYMVVSTNGQNWCNVTLCGSCHRYFCHCFSDYVAWRHKQCFFYQQMLYLYLLPALGICCLQILVDGQLVTVSTWSNITYTGMNACLMSDGTTLQCTQNITLVMLLIIL